MVGVGRRRTNAAAAAAAATAAAFNLTAAAAVVVLFFRREAHEFEGAVEHGQHFGLHPERFRVALLEHALVGARVGHKEGRGGAQRAHPPKLLRRAQVGRPRRQQHHALVHFLRQPPAVVLFNVALHRFETPRVRHVCGDSEAQAVNAQAKERVSPGLADGHAHESQRQPHEKEDEVHRESEDDRALWRTRQHGERAPQVVGKGV
mmetsp:Transcript_46377/g.86440  ORF Transcript_46377/g.86440 Transcript_46377/m.86440 type:complete len:205 (+) Transcript_46377:1789-2403(+)